MINHISNLEGMAKFLTTKGNSYHIEQIIINAEKTLTLVTPYLKLSQMLYERLIDADNRGVQIILVYGKSELAAAERDKIFSLNNIAIYYNHSLHAKCYFNESEMIITSMNLYDFSEVNNREMGILLDRKKDRKIFDETCREVESIVNASEIEKNGAVNGFGGHDEQNIYKLHPDFNESYNFHLPPLAKLLAAKYPHKNVLLENELTIDDFPASGVNMLINGRIDFYFQKYLNYELSKKKSMNIINKALPGIRCYWNYYQLNVYMEKGYWVEMNKEGQKELTEKFFYVINTINDLLKVYE